MYCLHAYTSFRMTISLIFVVYKKHVYIVYKISATLIIVITVLSLIPAALLMGLTFCMQIYLVILMFNQKNRMTNWNLFIRDRSLLIQERWGRYEMWGDQTFLSKYFRGDVRIFNDGGVWIYFTQLFGIMWHTKNSCNKIVFIYPWGAMASPSQVKSPGVAYRPSIK
jgi:hypothetical protein